MLGIQNVLPNITLEQALKIIDVFPVPARIIDRNMRIWQNDRDKQLFPRKYDEEFCFQFLDGVESICPDCPVQKLFSKGIKEVTERSYNGKLFKVTTSPIYNKSGVVIAALEALVDNSDAIIRYEQVLRLATKDELTDTYNRRGFAEQIKREISHFERTKNPFGLMFLDIDHFKLINDNHDHDIGDIILKELLNLLSARLRKTDWVCRYGGDEFIVVFPETNLEGTIKIANDIREDIFAHEFMESIRTTISAGIAEYDPSYKVEEILKLADQALYESKEKGRNTITVVQNKAGT